MNTPLEPIEDVCAAIDYVRARATPMGVDAERLAMLGFSLGTGPWHVAAAMQRSRPYIRALALYYTLLDFEDSEVRPSPELANTIASRTFLERAGAAFPPTFLATAGRERFTGINRSNDRFVDLARKLGARVERMTHETGEHGFDTKAPDPRTTEIMMATVEFLRAALA